MSRRTWDVRQVGRFVVRRYCRLGIPYLAAIALAVAAGAFGRSELGDSVVGNRPTWDQLLAHVFFLQDILGYESLSAGLWFVCIDFQLGLIYVALLYLRDGVARSRGAEPGEANSTVPMVLGGGLAASSLFHFNLHDRYDMWALFFFGQFFLGVMVYHGLKAAKWLPYLGCYAAMMVAALAYDWRWRQVTSLLIGLVLFGGGRSGLMERWPASRLVAYLGRTSYSLFLIHYPVLIAVSSLWVRFGWSGRSSAIAGLIVVYAASLLVADLFFRAVEAPATLLARKFF
jgi:peptidoglycan/LPS O-acetylase OafA/YrhL